MKVSFWKFTLAINKDGNAAIRGGPAGRRESERAIWPGFTRGKINEEKCINPPIVRAKGIDLLEICSI